ncbi:hypothetical protein C8R47DRAFT_1209684 [Mycena vitilis]|nr:hypothetical protein C8R47DRAFT_1209684 [Mycena vitilis]
MPPHSTTQTRLSAVATSVEAAVTTLELVSASLSTPFLNVISVTTRSLLNFVENVKQNKDDCTRLLEQIHQLLYAIIALHIKSSSGGELSPIMLTNIGNFKDTLHKVHHFIEAQQGRNRIKHFFRQGEMSALLKDCRAGLQQALDYFQISRMDLIAGAAELEDQAVKSHQEVLELFGSTESSDGASSIDRRLASTESSTTSISMLPSEPHIFHGRESELSDVLDMFIHGATGRIALLGPGGIGKTSLARAVVHSPDIVARYGSHRFFVSCDTVSTKVELAGLIGAHLGLVPSGDLTRSVIRHFSKGPACLLILDNFETLWDSTERRGEVEEFLSLLTDIQHLALIITMRGAERPAKIQWTRPFLPPLRPLSQEAALKTFVDIADDVHDDKDVNKILLLTGNMPLAIYLMAHLVESEGCSNVLSRWEEEKTSIISEGYDRKSNLELSISLSLSSPRITSMPQAKDLLRLLSMLPDGLSDVELQQGKVPIVEILACKAALLRTSLAYNDEQKRLKTLVPIREYMKKYQPADIQLSRPLLAYFHQLLDLYQETRGTLAHPGLTGRLASNFANMQSLLLDGLHADHPDLVANIYSSCYLDMFSLGHGRGPLPFLASIRNTVPRPTDHRLEAYILMRYIHSSWRYRTISDPGALLVEAEEHFKYFADADLESRFCIAAGSYYQYHDDDRSSAMVSYQKALSIATSTGNSRRQIDSLDALANVEWQNGDYLGGWKHANEARRLARVSADLYREARGSRTEALFTQSLGNYKATIALCTGARELLALCGLSGGEMECAVLNTQSEMHNMKSEYLEACSIQEHILQTPSFEADPYDQAIAVFNRTEVRLKMRAPTEQMEKDIATVRSLFRTMGYRRGSVCCDMLSGDLELSKGNMSVAEQLFRKCVRSSQGRDGEIMTYCLERLGNPSNWRRTSWSQSWSTVFLAHVLQSQEKLAIYKALQFLGDVFLAEGEAETASSLFNVALEGFVQLDVHRSRAECMVRLGVISQQGGDFSTALGLWQSARPLFARSSQARQIADTDGKLAVLAEDLKAQSLATLEQLHAPTGLGFVENTGTRSPQLADSISGV